LYKTSVDGTLLKCLGESEACVTYVEIREGICGAHQAGRREE